MLLSGYQKYGAVLKTGIVNAFYLRGEMLIWVLLSILPLFAMLLVWPAVYQSPQSPFQFSLGYILTYYLAGTFISAFIINHFDTWMIDRVRQGDITRDFLQPFSPAVKVILIEAGWRVVRTLLFSIPIALVLILIYRDIIIYPSVMSLVMLFPFLFTGFIISGLINLLVVSAAFKIEHASSLIHLRWALETIFAGSLVPFELLPSSLQSIAKVLPFRFLYFVPSQLFLNQYTLSQAFFQLGSCLIWLVLLSCIVKIIWNNVLKSYTAVGN